MSIKTDFERAIDYKFLITKEYYHQDNRKSGHTINFCTIEVYNRKNNLLFLMTGTHYKKREAQLDAMKKLLDFKLHEIPDPFYKKVSWLDIKTDSLKTYLFEEPPKYWIEESKFFGIDFEGII